MSRLARIAPLTGVAFLVLALAGVVSMGESPDFAAPASEFTEFYTDDKGRIILGAMLFNVSIFFLLWFVGTVTTAARRAEGGDGRVSRVAFGGGVSAATLAVGGMSLNLMAALRVDDQGAIADEVAVVYGDISTTLTFLAASIGFSVLLAGVALVNARTRFLPAWLTWVTAIMAVGLLEPYFSWAFVILVPIWTAVVGSLLFLQQPDTVVAEPAAA
jgi:hypothetical protein